MCKRPPAPLFCFFHYCPSINSCIPFIYPNNVIFSFLFLCVLNQPPLHLQTIHHPPTHPPPSSSHQPLSLTTVSYHIFDLCFLFKNNFDLNRIFAARRHTNTRSHFDLIMFCLLIPNHHHHHIFNPILCLLSFYRFVFFISGCVGFLWT